MSCHSLYKLERELVCKHTPVHIVSELSDSLIERHDDHRRVMMKSLVPFQNSGMRISGFFS